MGSSFGSIAWSVAALSSMTITSLPAAEQTAPRQSKQAAISLTLVATREDLREALKPLLPVRDRKELEKQCLRLGVAIVDLGDLGVIIEDGDPLGIESRAAKVSMLREVSAMIASGRGWIRVEEFSDSGKRELGSMVAELARSLSCKPPKDYSKVPVAFGVGATVALKHGDKVIEIPLAPPDPPERVPDTSSLPVADPIKPAEVPAEVARANIPKSLQFHSAASQTGIAKRLRLIEAYCALQAPKAEALFQEWNSIAEALGKRQGSPLGLRGKKLADIPLADRQRIETEVISQFSSYGFGSRAEAEAYLQGATITDHLSYVKVQLSLRKPNGDRTGGSFPIHP